MSKQQVVQSRGLERITLQMVSNFEEVLVKFDNATRLLDKISEECQKYANLLLVNSRQSENCSSCCNEIVADLKQARLLIKRLIYNKEQLAAAKAKENCGDERDVTAKRDRAVRRNTRTSSMKYLQQWERVVEAQMAEAAPQTQDEPQLLPKPVIKRRMRQFENKDTKRISSTADFFLDETDESSEGYGGSIQEGEEGEEEELMRQKNESVKGGVANSEESDHFCPTISEVLEDDLQEAESVNEKRNQSSHVKIRIIGKESAGSKGKGMQNAKKASNLKVTPDVDDNVEHNTTLKPNDGRKQLASPAPTRGEHFKPRIVDVVVSVKTPLPITKAYKNFFLVQTSNSR